jgi:hypothetical protein
MDRASQKLEDRAATWCGRLLAFYGRAAVTPAATTMMLEAPLPHEPCVWVSWHESNFLALALHGPVMKRRGVAFVPPGLRGSAMRGLLEGLGLMPVLLVDGAKRGLALRQMEAALANGRDVLIAVDGPEGPRHRIAPGALWLAQTTGKEVWPVACTASPAFRLPRWDRLIVPVPGARIGLAIGAPFNFRGRAGRSEAALASVAGALHQLAVRADEGLAKHDPKTVETASWR